MRKYWKWMTDVRPCVRTLGAISLDGVPSRGVGLVRGGSFEHGACGETGVVRNVRWSSRLNLTHLSVAVALARSGVVHRERLGKRRER